MYLLKLLKKKVRNMSKIKIYELADKLGVERKELLSKAQ
ncbi:translation initiation factor IF-2 N-terminal domain-containing protein, partial [Lactococcus lactis]